MTQPEETPSSLGSAQRIQSAVAELFTVHDVTVGLPGQPDAIRLRGFLQAPSQQAFPQISARLRDLGYTAWLRHDRESRMQALLAVPGVVPQDARPRYWLHALLFGATILTTLYAGAGMAEGRPADDLWWPLFHLWSGWPFSLALLSILLAHELGHYFVSRHHGVARSLPYFIPLPLPDFLGNVLGTMGAVILMKAPVTNRRVMLDVGAAGPIVGTLVAIPVLLIGLSLSHVKEIVTDQAYMLEGSSLLYLGLKFLIFRQWLPGGGLDVFIHPVAFAGWAGLLVTSLNLIPAGQFDGGHIVYSILGERAQRIAWPLVFLLFALGVILWQGWLIWGFLVLVMGQRHPGPLDGVTELDRRRKWVAGAALLLLVLTFTPIPLTIVDPTVGPQGIEPSVWLAAGLAACWLWAKRTV
jgi:membrane-associated protease RseP (regulator of RpoE activity)